MGKQPVSPRTEVNSTRPAPATESRFRGFARMLQYTPNSPPPSSSEVLDLINTLEAENARLRALTASLPRQLLAELDARGSAEEARTQSFARALIVVALMLLSFAAGLRVGAGAASWPANDQSGMSWRSATTAPRDYKGMTRNGVGLLHVTAVEPGPGYAGVGLLRLGPRRPHADPELQMRLFASLRH